MAACADIAVAGETLRLLADRAAYWPAKRRLLVADLHLGKGDVFRAAGIPVPSGGTAHDLDRLDALLRATQARSLWILGDFLHATPHPAVLDAWRAFREANASLSICVVRGNHDRLLDAPGAGLVEVADGTREGPFAFRHAPVLARKQERDSAHVICGHVHPVVRLPGVGRTPLFWLREDALVLPAFSRFTGGHRIDVAACSGSVVCNGQSLVRLP